MRRLSASVLALALLFAVLVPQVPCDEGYKLQAEIQWWRCPLYTMAWEKSGTKIKTLDKVFDCDDWATLYVMYMGSLCKIEKPGIMIVHKKGERKGHAMGYFVKDGKHVVCDAEYAYSAHCDSLDVCRRAAVSLWKTLHSSGVDPTGSYSAYVEPIDKMIRENWR